MGNELCIICGAEIGPRHGEFKLTDPNLGSEEPDFFLCEKHAAVMAVAVIKASPEMLGILLDAKGVFPNVEKMLGLDDGN